MSSEKVIRRQKTFLRNKDIARQKPLSSIERPLLPVVRPVELALIKNQALPASRLFLRARFSTKEPRKAPRESPCLQ
jgi:hypothetical protein